jgi:hypothetical protein
MRNGAYGFAHSSDQGFGSFTFCAVVEIVTIDNTVESSKLFKE